MVGLASGTIADGARQIDADAGLGVRIELGFEADASVTVERLRDEAQQTLQMGEGQTVIDPQTSNWWNMAR